MEGQAMYLLEIHMEGCQTEKYKHIHLKRRAYAFDIKKSYIDSKTHYASKENLTLLCSTKAFIKDSYVCSNNQIKLINKEHNIVNYAT